MGSRAAVSAPVRDAGGVLGARPRKSLYLSPNDELAVVERTWNHPEWFPVDCSVYLDNCSGVDVDGLTVSDPGLVEAAIFIGAACDAGEAGVKLGTVDADLPDGVPLARDAR